MTGWRVYPALLLLVVIAPGCRSGPPGPKLAPPAKPRTIELGWVERNPAQHFTFRVKRLVVAEDAWRAEVSVTNSSRTGYRLEPRSFGLALFDTPTRAELRRLTGNLQHAPPALRPDRVVPLPPPVLGPGAVWSGTITGSEVLRDGSVVRVLFGPFSPAGERFRGEAQDVFWITDHAVPL
jgi:hypothetical protein